MTKEALEGSKDISFAQLRAAFIGFVDVLLKIPGTTHSKQQALVRFDEGHMWMQNAIMTYNPPPAANETPEVKMSPELSLPDPGVTGTHGNEEVKIIPA